MIATVEYTSAQPTDADLVPLRSEHRMLGTCATRLEETLEQLARHGDRSAEETKARVLLDEFGRRLFAHLRAEEESGVLERAAAAEPHLETRVTLLLDEHAELRARIETLIGAAIVRDWAAVHVSFVAFHRDLRDHEHREDDVLQQAYLDDLGGGD